MSGNLSKSAFSKGLMSHYNWSENFRRTGASPSLLSVSQN